MKYILRFISIYKINELRFFCSRFSVVASFSKKTKFYKQISQEIFDIVIYIIFLLKSIRKVLLENLSFYFNLEDVLY